MPGKVTRATIKRRYDRITALADELCAQRAEERVGSTVEVLVDTVADGSARGAPRTRRPEVDGSTTLIGGGERRRPGTLRPGDLVRARVTGTRRRGPGGRTGSADPGQR